MRRDAQRLADIVEAAAQIAGYVDSKTSIDFTFDRLFQDAVLRQLTIVGEAAARLSPEFKARHPEIAWQKIAGFRHRIVHDYFGFNLDTAWEVATVALPELNIRVSRICAVEFPDYES